jgi:hypothetical protein
MFSQDSNGASDSTPSEVRKRGRYPRTYYTLLTGPWDLDVQSRHSDGALPVKACRAKRENAGLGQDLPGSTIEFQQKAATLRKIPGE